MVQSTGSQRARHNLATEQQASMNLPPKIKGQHLDNDLHLTTWLNAGTHFSSFSKIEEIITQNPVSQFPYFPFSIIRKSFIYSQKYCQPSIYSRMKNIQKKKKSSRKFQKPRLEFASWQPFTYSLHCIGYFKQSRREVCRRMCVSYMQIVHHLAGWHHRLDGHEFE